MNLRKTYLDAADYVREHGFSAHFDTHGGPCCFIAAIACVVGGLNERWDRASDGPLNDVAEYGCDSIKRHGWTKNDAIAAFEIAADLATP
jgi:hypothetical protein